MILNWYSVQHRICPKCLDGNRKGDCLLAAGDSCPLKESFATIVNTVARVESNKYEDYVAALRRDICATCAHQDGDGVCRRRNQIECALDRYFPLVVEIIDAARVMTM